MILDALRAAQKKLHSKDGSAVSESRLRPDQNNVFNDFVDFLGSALDQSTDNPTSSFGRIILPPRLGKTVIAAKIFERTRLSGVFIVPTQTLIEQTMREFRDHAPNVPVGVYYQHEKRLIEQGVNVVTYASMTAVWQEHGCLPKAIAASPLIFVDEAHHAMTTKRHRMMQDGFDPQAIRIALTASPDYDEDRRLAHIYPSLIHEITLGEAVELDLLAPVRVWVHEVDVSASTVNVRAGDYHDGELGEIMSGGPFFEAVRSVRYHEMNRHVPALICCQTQKQARSLHAFLNQTRPSDSPEVALILSGSKAPSKKRQPILDAYANGDLDTIVNVGVLIEGWSSARCKLLLDVAPTMSRVRALQKFFRVMTRNGSTESFIHVFLPKELPSSPLLPMDFLLPFGEQSYTSGQLIRSREPGPPNKPDVVTLTLPLIAKVKLVSRVIMTGLVEKPTLDPRSIRQIVAVMHACREFDPMHPCGIYSFRWLMFRHQLFTGRGEQLLRYIGIECDRNGYARLMQGLFPGSEIPTSNEREMSIPSLEVSCKDDVRRFDDLMTKGAGSAKEQESVRSCWQIMVGGWPEEDLDDLIQRKEEIDFFSAFIKNSLTGFNERLLLQFLEGETCLEQGEKLGLSKTRINQILTKIKKECAHAWEFRHVQASTKTGVYRITLEMRDHSCITTYKSARPYTAWVETLIETLSRNDAEAWRRNSATICYSVGERNVDGIVIHLVVDKHCQYVSLSQNDKEPISKGYMGIQELKAAESGRFCFLGLRQHAGRYCLYRVSRWLR